MPQHAPRTLVRRAMIRPSFLVVATLTLPALIAGACSSSNSGASGPSNGGSGSNPSGNGAGSTGSLGTGGGGIINFDSGVNDGPSCPRKCSTDYHAVVDCNDNVVMACTGTQGCDPQHLDCADACTVAVDAKTSVGCEYYATNMDQASANLCFAAFVANTWDTPAHISGRLRGDADADVAQLRAHPLRQRRVAHLRRLRRRPTACRRARSPSSSSPGWRAAGARVPCRRDHRRRRRAP